MRFTLPKLTLVKLTVGLHWSFDVAFSSWILRHHHHVLFETQEIFTLVTSQKVINTCRVDLFHVRSKEFELELREEMEVANE